MVKEKHQLAIITVVTDSDKNRQQMLKTTGRGYLPSGYLPAKRRKGTFPAEECSRGHHTMAKVNITTLGDKLMGCASRCSTKDSKSWGITPARKAPTESDHKETILINPKQEIVYKVTAIYIL